MELRRLLPTRRSKRQQREADGILKVASLFNMPHFSYAVYQEAVELLQIEVPEQVDRELKRFDSTPWDQMNQDAKLFVYQSCMALLPTPL